MGCGVSTMAADGEILGCHPIPHIRQNKTVVTENKKIHNVEGDHNIDSSTVGVRSPEEKGEQLEEHETDGEDDGRDDGFDGIRSPSFRVYFNNNESPSFSKGKSFKEDTTFRENIKSDGHEDSTITLNKQHKEDLKESEKKKRKGRWGRPGKRRNFLTSWYHSNASSNQTTHDQAAGIAA